MVSIRYPGPTLNNDDIRKFEDYLGRKLPEQYREFLLKYNGGRPSPNIVDIQGLEGGCGEVLEFGGLNRRLETERLDWYYQLLRECRIEAWQLPIASDSGGNAYILSLRDEDRGAITYCDLQSVYGRLDVKPEFYPVAPDFNTFLEKLHELTDTE